MNVPTISMPASEARAKLRAARSQLHRQAEDEYQRLIDGYEALAKGHQLINLADVFHACPLDAQGRPKLAVCRADREEVYLRWYRGDHEFQMHGVPKLTRRGRPARSLFLGFRFQRPSAQTLIGSARVPMIPPDVLPKHGQRKDWHILWEAEWSPLMPRDPLLLKHVGGSVYAILAQWDLTDLERAVMAGAFSK